MLRVLDIAPPDAYSSLAYPSSVIDDALKRAAVCFHPDKRRRHSPTLGLSMDRIWEMYKEAAVVAKLGPTFQSISSSNCPIEKSNRHMEAAAKFLEIPRYSTACSCGLPEALSRATAAAFFPYWLLPGNQFPPPAHVNRSGVSWARTEAMSAAILPYWPFLGKQSSALDVLSPQASKTSFCPPCTVSAAWQPWSFFLDNLPPAGHYF
jgi:hypothetical protein